MSQQKHEKPVVSLRARHAWRRRPPSTRPTPPVALDQTLQGRISHMDTMTQQQMAKAGRAQLALALRRIRGALARAEAGTYGLCCRCREAIDPARLEADPAAPFCMDCLEEIAEERADQARLEHR